MRLSAGVLLAALGAAAHGADPWDKYNLSPGSRTLHPVGLYNDSEALAYPIELNATRPSVTFDFGKEVGGFTSVTFAAAAAAAGGDAPSVSYFWSESSLFIGAGDRSNGGSGPDGALGSGALPVGRASTWTAGGGELRGGFRYFRVVLDAPTSGAAAVIGAVGLNFTAAPHMADLRQYKAHFYSSDELVNRIWYGCAYTIQMCSIASQQGRQWPPPARGWANNATCGSGGAVLVDGAKRDRTIWPGDMGVSTLTAFNTLGDTSASQHSLETLYAHQLPDGMMPYAGPPVSFEGNSDTYHLWALGGTLNFFAHTNDRAWLSAYWGGFQRAVNASLAKVGARGLMVVTATADWQRSGQGGENVAANTLLYDVLRRGAAAARALEDAATAAAYQSRAESLADAINAHLWDAGTGAYRDNPTSGLRPQDGNALAAWFGVAGRHPGRAASVSAYLRGNWGAYGSASPEWNGGRSIGTFPGSMEVYAHLAAGNGTRALDLIRLQWGYMLNSPLSVGSTFWEGYNVDGSFNFQGDYMSHAHGWAAGPGGALQQHVLGIRAEPSLAPPGAAGGAAGFVVAPQPSGLRWADGSVAFADDHVVAAAWHAAAGAFELRLQLAKAHPLARGRVELPLDAFLGCAVVVTRDGARVASRRVGAAADRRPRHVFDVRGGGQAVQVFRVAKRGACSPGR